MRFTKGRCCDKETEHCEWCDVDYKIGDVIESKDCATIGKCTELCNHIVSIDGMVYGGSAYFKKSNKTLKQAKEINRIKDESKAKEKAKRDKYLAETPFGCHLRLDMYVSFKVHPQEYMKELGITYQHATPQSIGDQWWFWNCENVPNVLPEALSWLKLKPMEQVGWGLSDKDAMNIANGEILELRPN